MKINILHPLPPFRAWGQAEKSATFLQEILGPEECQKLIKMAHDDIRTLKTNGTIT